MARHVPAGMRLQRYGAALVQGEEELTPFWGSAERFLAHGLGYAVMEGDRPVSRCYTVLVGGGLAEISISTVETHRRRGLATLVLGAFIEGCREAGLEPRWSCWDNNAASLALAKRSGFVNPCDVPVAFAPRQAVR